MKTIIFLTIFYSISTLAFSQKASEFYEKALLKAESGDLEEAIELFSKSIELQPEDYYSWYNRGIAKNMLGLYEDALPDFEQTVKLAPEYKKGLLNRGTTKKRLTDYEGALSDYSSAIKLDPNYSEAFYNRGLVFEMLNKIDSACDDFKKANDLGVVNANKKLENCNDTSRKVIPINSILRLKGIADNDKYGFTQEQPVKVGVGPDGGPANQRMYLNLLRDVNGKQIKYKRLGSCCPQETENNLIGYAMLDQYEITYLNEAGIEKKTIVYLSMYDFEEPKILYGFKTIGKK